jgi:hypothetical protein
MRKSKKGFGKSENPSILRTRAQFSGASLLLDILWPMLLPVSALTLAHPGGHY